MYYNLDIVAIDGPVFSGSFKSDMESQEESNNARASYEYWGRAIGDIDADGEPAF